MICVWKIYLYLQFFSFLLLMQLLWGWKTFFYSHHSLENFAYLLEVSYQGFLRYIAHYYHAKAFLHFCYFSVDLYRKRNRYRKICRVPNDNRLIVDLGSGVFITSCRGKLVLSTVTRSYIVVLYNFDLHAFLILSSELSTNKQTGARGYFIRFLISTEFTGN